MMKLTTKLGRRLAWLAILLVTPAVFAAGTNTLNSVVTQFTNANAIVVIRGTNVMEYFLSRVATNDASYLAAVTNIVGGTGITVTRDGRTVTNAINAAMVLTNGATYNAAGATNPPSYVVTNIVGGAGITVTRDGNTVTNAVDGSVVVTNGATGLVLGIVTNTASYVVTELYPALDIEQTNTATRTFISASVTLNPTNTAAAAVGLYGYTTGATSLLGRVSQTGLPTNTVWLGGYIQPSGYYFWSNECVAGTSATLTNVWRVTQ